MSLDPADISHELAMQIAKRVRDMVMSYQEELKIDNERGESGAASIYDRSELAEALRRGR